MSKITICMLCGKSHKKTPEECLFKGAVMSALLKALLPSKDAHLGMLILDKTPFLQDAWANYQARGEK